MARHQRSQVGALPFVVGCLVLLATCSTAQDIPTYPVYQVAGSGTSNPAPLLWQMMQLFSPRTKPSGVFSYRSIGTGAGQTEFVGPAPYNVPLNAFSSGDFPMTKPRFDNVTASGNGMIQFPFMLGTVSIFVNIPGLPQGALRLSPCTLAGIFSGNITVWNHSQILSDNIGTQATSWLRNDPIQILRRSGSSSSSLGLTTYLNRTCRSIVTPTTDRITWNYANVGIVDNSQAMSQGIYTTPYSIGYVESGQGVAMNLNEVLLRNAQGEYLTSTQSTPVASLDTLTNLTLSVDADWSSIDFINLNSSSAWPITLATFFYLRKDLDSLGPAGGLVRTFLSFMLSEEVQPYITSYGFVQLSGELRNRYNNTLYTLTNLNKTRIPDWTLVETSGVQVNTGMDDYTISPLRQSYLYNQLQSVTTNTNKNTRYMQYGNGYQVHGAGSFFLSSYMLRAMGALKAESRLPIYMTYRQSGSRAAIQELLHPQTVVASYQQFKATDEPLDTREYQNLTTSGNQYGIMQIPVLVGSISFYHNAPVPGFNVRLDACTIIRILRGIIYKWNDPKLLELNPQWDKDSPLLDHPITIFVYAADTNVVAQKLLQEPTVGWFPRNIGRNCPELASGSQDWAMNKTVQAYSSSVPAGILTPNDMAVSIQTTPYSIGFMPTIVNDDEGINMDGMTEVFLPLGNNTGYGPSQAARQGVHPGICYTELLGNALPGADEVGWVTLKEKFWDLQCNGTWPLSFLTYVMAYKNLTQYGVSGPLTKAYFEYLLSEEAQNGASFLGYWRLPTSWTSFLTDQLSKFTTENLLQDWTFENSASASGVLGSGLYSFSTLRQDPMALQITDIQSKLSDLTSQMEVALPLVMRVTGPRFMAPIVTKALEDIKGASSRPVNVLFDPVEVAPELVYLLEVESLNKNYRILFNDGPITHLGWNRTTHEWSKPIVQVPIAAEAVTFVYNGAEGVNLPPCFIARALRGDALTWSDRELVESQTTIGLLNAAAGKPLRLRFPSYVTNTQYGQNRLVPHGNMEAVRRYLLKACPESASYLGSYLNLPNQDVATTPGAPSYTQNIVAEIQGAGAWGDIAVLNRGSYTRSGGLQEGKIRELAKTPSTRYITLDDAQHLGTGFTKARAQSDVSGWSMTVTGDWSNFSMVGYSDDAGTSYPIARADFIVAPADLSTWGDLAPFTLAAIQYWAGYWQRTFNPVQLQGVQGLPPGATSVGATDVSSSLTDQINPATMRLPHDQEPWLVVPGSLENPNLYGSGNAIVTGTYMASTDPTSDPTQAITIATIMALQQQIWSLNNQVKDANDTAIAAVTLATIALTALGILALCVACGWVGVAVYKKRYSKSAGLLRNNGGERHVELSVDAPSFSHLN